MSDFINKWDRRFLALAHHIAGWSKDPSTKVGAVIVDGDWRIISTGYNGFPRGVNDDDSRLKDRATRLKMTCHAERNAILFARRDLRGCTLYTTLMPCAACAGMIIQAGIRCVCMPETPPELEQRWAEDFALTRAMFAEARVKVVVIGDQP